jgi:hypothetical protein
MNYWFASIVAQEHQRDILREAEKEHLIAQLQAHTPRRTLWQRVTSVFFTHRLNQQPEVFYEAKDKHRSFS